MNTYEIRIYLHNFENLKEEIKNLQEDLAIYEKLEKDGLRSSFVSDMPRTSKMGSVIEHQVMGRPIFILKIKEEIDTKMKLRRAIESVVLYLSPKKKEIIELRYFKNWSWKQIEDKLNLQCVRKIDVEIVNKIYENFLVS